jgi:hypothetical protein
MRPRLAAAVSALLLATILPATVTAEPALRFEDHHIGFFCEREIDDGFVAAHIDVSSAFGDFGGAEAWLGDVLPFEDPPTLSGGTEDVTVTATADGFELSVSFVVFDADGNDLGIGAIDATLTGIGDPEPLTGERFGNRNTFVEGTFQPMDVTATLTLPTIGELELSCPGDETIVKVLETNPHTFVISNAGIVVDCHWDDGDTFAGFFAISDSFGSFVDAFIVTPDDEFFSTGATSLDLTTSAVSAVVEIANPATEELGEATADASLSPMGDPVSSVIETSTSRDKVTEQRLSVDGELAFSTGHAFAMNDDACFANTFDSHQVNSGPAGPKPGGRAPVNDTPDGALPLDVGSQVNAQTGGAAIEPELIPATCPDGESDKMGRTLWYTVEGTGDEITIDTAGSNFDTVLAVYVLEGEELVEIACIDDVFFDPIGLTFQASITGPTEEGVTYYVQIGGFDSRDRGGNVEFGRLRITVS